eukprot:TRINITY_DN18134_c0_g1_i1.p1 TRINITY_DN18134_c0_g1~~TRINITY_DN18134_c0_g1_i1.p1  ORF type:complete len:656 (+),score=206.61 TRINITY_DN18134_c0_g1_i1:54-2021(+)
MAAGQEHVGDAELNARAAAIAMRSAHDQVLASRQGDSDQESPPPAVLPPHLRRPLMVGWGKQLQAEQLLTEVRDGLDKLGEYTDAALPKLEEKLLALLKRVAAADGRQRPGEKAARNEVEELLQGICQGQRAAGGLRAALAAKAMRGTESFTTAALAVLSQLSADLKGVRPAVPGSLLLSSLSDATIATVMQPRESVSVPITITREDTQLRLEAGITAVCQGHIPGQDTLYVGLQSGRLLRVSPVARTVAAEYPGHQYPVLVLRVLQLRGRVCLVSAGRDKTVRISDLQSFEPLHCLTEHSGCVTALHAINGTLFTTSLDGTVSWWHLRRGRRDGALIRIAANFHCSIFNNASGDLFLGCRSGSLLRFHYDVSEAPFSAAACAEWKAHKGSALCMAFQPEGFLITGGEDCAVVVWDISDPSTSRAVCRLQKHVDSVTAVLPTADGLLFSASADALVVCWDLSSGTALRVCKGHHHHVTGLALVSIPDLPAGSEEGPDAGVRRTYSELRRLLALPDDMFSPQGQSSPTPQRQSTPPNRRSRPESPNPQQGQRRLRPDSPAPADLTTSPVLAATGEVSRWETGGADFDGSSIPEGQQPDTHMVVSRPPSQRQARSAPPPEPAEVPMRHYLVSVSLDHDVALWRIDTSASASDVAAAP